MVALLEKIAHCVEAGKVDKSSPYPPEMKGMEGADELTVKALESGLSPDDILNKGFLAGMDKVGKKFAENKVFVPQLLLSARAMTAAIKHLEPFFQSGVVKRRGVFVIGTVFGDLHDIGKNLVSLMVEGCGWQVVDLGVDVKPVQFVNAIEEHPGCAIGMSAMLTTTMMNMREVVIAVREQFSGTKILVGGAPLNRDFCNMIEADYYSPNPRGVVEYLNNLEE